MLLKAQPKGSFIISPRKIAMDWEWTRPKVVRYLNLLEINNLIIRDNFQHKSTMITICNWEQIGIKEASKIIPANPDIKPMVERIIKRFNEVCNTRFRYCQKTHSMINARLKDGFTEEDFYKVIEEKCNDWNNDSQMRQYLRPTTLFRPTKFPEYLGQKKETDNYEQFLKGGKRQ